MLKQTGKWYALLYTKEDKKQKYGGYFDNELDAAKKVNQICEKLGIPPKNPEISGIPNQEVTKKHFSVPLHYEQNKTCQKFVFQFLIQKENISRLYFKS